MNLHFSVGVDQYVSPKLVDIIARRLRQAAFGDDPQFFGLQMAWKLPGSIPNASYRDRGSSMIRGQAKPVSLT